MPSVSTAPQTFDLTRQLPAGRPDYYRAALTAISSYAGTHSLDPAMLTPDFINGFTDWLLKKGKSQHTVAAYFRALRALYNADVRRGVCPRIDAFRHPQPIVTSPASVIPEDTLSRLATHNFGPLASYARVRDLIMFSFHSRGITFSEILSLKTDAVNGSYLTLSDGSLRIVTSAMADIIARYRQPGSTLLLGNDMPPVETVNELIERINSLLDLGINWATLSMTATWEAVARNHHIDPSMAPDNAATRISAIVTGSRLRWWAIINNEFDSTDEIAATLPAGTETFIPRITIATRTPQGVKHRPDPTMNHIIFVRATVADIDAMQSSLGQAATVMFNRDNGSRHYTPISDHDMHIFRIAVNHTLDGIDPYSPDDRELAREQHVVIVGHPLFDGLEGYIADIDATRVNISVRLPLFHCRLITPQIHREFIRIIK